MRERKAALETSLTGVQIAFRKAYRDKLYSDFACDALDSNVDEYSFGSFTYYSCSVFWEMMRW